MLNNIILMGRIVRDPELRTTQAGTPVTNFRIAVDRDRSEADGTRKADFIDVVAWRQLAEFICRNFSKGRSIVVTGRLTTREWTDKDGSKRNAVEVDAGGVYFAGDSKPAPVTAAADYSDLSADDPDCPF